MQAYYEINTTVPSNHQLNIKLPESIPTGKIKIAVIYEVIEPVAEFLNLVPENDLKDHSNELAQINQYAEELNQEAEDVLAYQVKF